MFKNHFDEKTQKWVTSETHEWTEDPSDSRLESGVVQNVPFENITKIITSLKDNQLFLSYKTFRRRSAA